MSISSIIIVKAVVRCSIRKTTSRRLSSVNGTAEFRNILNSVNCPKPVVHCIQRFHLSYVQNKYFAMLFMLENIYGSLKQQVAYFNRSHISLLQSCTYMTRLQYTLISTEYSENSSKSHLRFQNVSVCEALGTALSAQRQQFTDGPELQV